MADGADKASVVSLAAFKKKQRAAAGKQSTLCGNGHHSWVVDKANVFDVKAGKLVTRWLCKRCGTSKVEAK